MNRLYEVPVIDEALVYTKDTIGITNDPFIADRLKRSGAAVYDCLRQEPLRAALCAAFPSRQVSDVDFQELRQLLRRR